MASAFSHAFVALALGRLCLPPHPPRRWLALGIAGALLPDADVLGFAWGVRYGDLWGHRGMSHSLSFALLLGVGLAWLVSRTSPRASCPTETHSWWRLAGYIALATASHGVCDALTNGGLGIAFFAPFDTTRYFFPWRPVRVSPISVRAFFSAWGLQIMASEWLYIWLPVTALWVGVRGAGAWRARR